MTETRRRRRRRTTLAFPVHHCNPTLDCGNERLGRVNGGGGRDLGQEGKRKGKGDVVDDRIRKHMVIDQK